MDPKMLAEIQRHDSNVPLEGFRFPKLKSKYQEKLELPDQFLRACTLREGTWVILLILQSVALATIGYLMACLFIMKKETDEWWIARFKDDFDYYYMAEHQDLIAKFWPLWVPFAQAIIGVKITYFITGTFVFYALIKKTVHPCWYLPWIIMTGLLVAIMWLMAFVMIIAIFVLLTYRPLTVTWDVGPIFCVIGYNVMWNYALFVVVAQYKRRWIVKYWRDRGVLINPKDTTGSGIEEEKGLPGY